MADTKISALTDGGALADGDVIPVVRAGSNVKASYPTGTAVVTDATTSRTLSDSDNGKYIRFTSASAVTVTTATGLSTDFECTIEQAGAGLVSVAAGASTTLNSRGSLTDSAGQYSVFGIKHVGSNVHTLFGDIA